MSISRPFTLVLVPLILAAQLGTLEAQTRAAAPAAQPPAPAQPVERAPMLLSRADADEIRNQLREVLRQYPPSLADVVRLDPTLLTSEQYISTYPALAAFLADHPEVARNPAYFLGAHDVRGWDSDTPQAEAVRMWRSVIEGLQIFAVIATITGVLAWLVKTLLDYRRWLRLSRVQTDVHTKLMDRFSANEDLLAYIQTPAGRRFLESAPIPIDAAEPTRAIGAPYSRILWSVQAGIVLALGGLALIFVGERQSFEEIGNPLESIGIITMAVGLGFVISAVASYLLSRRLGLLSPPATPSHADTGASL